ALVLVRCDGQPGCRDVRGQTLEVQGNWVLEAVEPFDLHAKIGLAATEDGDCVGCQPKAEVGSARAVETQSIRKTRPTTRAKAVAHLDRVDSVGGRCEMQRWIGSRRLGPSEGLARGIAKRQQALQGRAEPLGTQLDVDVVAFTGLKGPAVRF